MATEKRLIDANALKERAIRVSTVKEHCYMKAVGTQEIDKAPTVDAVEVVHSRFVNVVDFGDDQGCFGYCERCGSIHHAQHPVALKVDYRWCRWCGAKMDGDGNG